MLSWSAGRPQDLIHPRHLIVAGCKSSCGKGFGNIKDPLHSCSLGVLNVCLKYPVLSLLWWFCIQAGGAGTSYDARLHTDWLSFDVNVVLTVFEMWLCSVFKCIARLWFYSALLLYNLDLILLGNIVLMPYVLSSIVVQLLQVSFITFCHWISLKCMVFCQFEIPNTLINPILLTATVAWYPAETNMCVLVTQWPELFMIWQIKGFSVSSLSIACKQDIESE